MPAKQPIKIVKRNQREPLATQLLPPERPLKTANQTRRDIFEIITAWIEETRETKQALHQRERLLLEPCRPVR